MKRIVMFLFLSSVMTMGIMAQDKPKDDAAKPSAKPEEKAAAPTVTADEILAKYVTALGGKEAIQKPTSITINGGFEIESIGVSGSFKTFAKAPDKLARVIEVPNYGTIRFTYDGAKGWSSEPTSGLRELAGLELAALKRESDFYGPINFKKNFPKLEVKGKEKVGTSDAYVVVATTAEGDSEKYYFDVASGLLVRHDAERENPQGKFPSEMYFDDYKAIDGVKIAHSVRQVTPMFSLTIKFQEIVHNTAIEDKTFGKPPEN